VLDRTDRRIVNELQKNARLSNKELAARVGLAPSSCLVRVRRLEQDGVITGYHARVDPRALGISLEAFVAIRLGRHRREAVDGFHEYVLSIPEVVGVYHVAGANDFLLHVTVRDAQHLRDMAMDAFTTREEVAHVETALIFEHRHAGVLPDLGGSD
jgi:DNA-binding Lrp family transcriptional regulator